MRTFLRFTAICLFTCAGLWAQDISTSQIKGTVQDPSGAAVPGAAVKATQTDTGVVRTANTETDGSYVLTSLPIGPYRLEVTKEGFAKYVQSGIVLQVATNPTIEITLKVGAVSESVQVEANTTLVETQSSGVGAVVDMKRVLDLPLIGRNVQDLITTIGAATAGSDGAQL
ncbi:MAG TPA: carboxypeptidase-like regulatory domain-containing protein, partial [Bryobacteraceae bacterium]|nr:carboxypeptidase-like regulatory domain-containing protein [Bryobacteraceae bacterium]